MRVSKLGTLSSLTASLPVLRRIKSLGLHSVLQQGILSHLKFIHVLKMVFHAALNISVINIRDRQLAPQKTRHKTTCPTFRRQVAQNSETTHPTSKTTCLKFKTLTSSVSEKSHPI